VELIRHNGGSVSLPSKIQGIQLRPGDRIRILSPCGGGYGAPLQRDVERVIADFQDGLISADTVTRHYGIVVDERNATVDHVTPQRAQAAAEGASDASRTPSRTAAVRPAR
jgi:N-methylhydantoinase B